MDVVRVVLHVLALQWTVSWRGVSKRIGAAGAGVLLTCVLVGVVAVQWWLHLKIADSIRYVIVSEVGDLVFPGLLGGFLLLCAMLRVVTLAFSGFSTDVMTLLMAAPLSRVTKAVIQVVPDLLANVLVSCVIGSLGLVEFALQGGGVSLVVIIIIECCCVVLVGAVSGVLELALLRVVHDDVAARAGSAVIMMALVCAVMMELYRSLEEGAGGSTLAQFGAFAVNHDALVAVCAVLVTAVFLGIWGASRSELTSVYFRAAHGRPMWSLLNSSVLATAMKNFGRDAENRLGVLGMFMICVLGSWMEKVSHIPVGLSVVVAVIVLAGSSCALSSFGGLSSVGWNIMCSPRRLFGATLEWQAGYVLSGALVSIGLVVSFCASMSVLDVNGGMALTVSEIVRYVGMTLWSVACGLAAGRVIPVKKGDILSLGASGLLCTVLFSVGLYAGRAFPGIMMVLVPLVLVIVSGSAVAWSVAGGRER